MPASPFQKKRSRSVAGLFLMPKCQHIHGCVMWLVAVQRDVTGLAETDDQFAQFWLFGEGTADIRRGFQ